MVTVASICQELVSSFQMSGGVARRSAFCRGATSFVWGWESSHKELMDSMRAKFRTYDKSWDDHTGHLDVFARQAIGIIFGGRQIAAAPQAAFWLISYADQTMKDFAKIRDSVDRLLSDPAAQP